MKLYAKTLSALGLALALTLTGCSGGGGGTSVGADANVNTEPNPTFTTTAALTEAVPAAVFGAAVSINSGTMAVGTSDDGTGASLQAVAWDLAGAASTVTSLPVGLATYSRANGVNNAGMVVGEMGSPIVAAMWADKATEAVELTGGIAAYGINDAGVIVGESATGAVVWEAGLATNLPVSVGATASAAYAVNNNATVSEIAGELTEAGVIYAVVWRKTGGIVEGPIKLPGSATLNGDAMAFGINDDGDVAGEIGDIDGFVHAVRWIKGAGTAYALEDLGVGSANGINSADRAVGHDGAGAKIWRASAPLAPFPVGSANPANSQALAINNDGAVVGTNNGKSFIALP